MVSRSIAVAVVLGSVLAASTAIAQTPPITIEHDVTVSSLVSDRFTWRDSANKPRSAALGHNDVSFNGVYGGALREFTYQLPDGRTRTAGVTTYGNGGYGGFGYVVSHSAAGNCVGDDSPLGAYYSGHWQRLFQGTHHVIFRFTQNYPRNCSATAPGQARTIPVTIDWVFSTGRDNPLWAITYDVDLVSPNAPVNTLFDDSRAPYGELNIDGFGWTDIDGVAWGDRYKFTSTSSPLTLNSSWTWNVQNTIPYVKEWIGGAVAADGQGDATMGIVQTQTMSQQDAAGARDPNYHDVRPFWGKTSANGNAGGTYKMPYQDEWPYQADADSLWEDPPGTFHSNNNARLTWRTQWGFLGQQSYAVNDNVVATAPGYPKKSYSTYIVLGTHSSHPVEDQVSDVETLQTVNLTTTVGAVAMGGPGGVGRADNVTFAPAGYNHVYGALAFNASGNRLDANIAVGSGTLHHPMIILGNYTGAAPQVVTLAGANLIADVDYFASVRTNPNELWLTLNRNLTGAVNHLQIAATSLAGPIKGDANGDGKADLVWRNQAAGQTQMWLMDGFTVTSSANLPLASPNWTIVGFGDFNNDGKTDLLWRHGPTGDVAIWLMNGTSIDSSAVVATVPSQWVVQGVGDFDGDGKSDILWRNSSTSEAVVWRMDGFAILSNAYVASPSSAWSVQGVGDFNLDGKTDILWRNADTNETWAWLMDGTGISSTGYVATPNSAWVIRGVGDFNGDRKADLLWRNTTTNEAVVWLMNGAAIDSAAYAATPPSVWDVRAVGDFNGDTRADLMWRNQSTGENVIWLMNGTQISSTGYITTVSDQSWTVAGPR